MSSQYPPTEDNNFASTNFINSEDSEYTIEELEQLFAKKYNTFLSGTSTISGGINITDNKRIYFNKNEMHSVNKCQRFEYNIESNSEKSFINIPLNLSVNASSSTNQARIYLLHFSVFTY